MREKVKIIGIGGSLDKFSTSYFALKFVMDEVHSLGAEIKLFDVAKMKFPIYDPKARREEIGKNIDEFLNEVQSAHGYILSSPEYHGTISGVLKNVIDYLQYLRHVDIPYLSGKPAGCISTGGGENSGVTTIQAMINIIHNLRGISVPGNVAIPSSSDFFDKNGKIIDEKIRKRLTRLAKIVFELAGRL